MSHAALGVGIIGVRPESGWGRAHVLAVAGQPENTRLVGIANSTAQSAHKAAAELGIARGFESVEALLACPDVELVTVTVKLPQHFALVKSALLAGKAVYCEWPLGYSLEESQSLTDMAESKSLYTAIGTQARVAPSMLFVRDLIAQNYVGELLSTTLIGSGLVWGAVIEEAGSYVLDAANRVSLLTIPFGHMMAVMEDLLGTVVSVSAQLGYRRKHCKILDTNEHRSMSTPDQLLVTGSMQGGLPFAVHYRGGVQRTAGLRWEINGTAGDLLILGPNGQGQMVELEVFGGQDDMTTVEKLDVPKCRFAHLPPHVVNLALMYERVAHDIRAGNSTAPSFKDAMRTHRLIAATEQAALTGQRVSVQARG